MKGTKNYSIRSSIGY